MDLNVQIWEAWRVVNMAIALAALLLHLGGFHLRSRATRGSEMGFLANAAWCLGYILATGVASLLPGGAPGPWTAIMSVPIGWTFAAGVFLWRSGR